MLDVSCFRVLLYVLSELGFTAPLAFLPHDCGGPRALPTQLARCLGGQRRVRAADDHLFELWACILPLRGYAESILVLDDDIP